MIRDPKNHTQTQRFRLAAGVWRRFGEAAGPRGRSAILVQFVHWFLREGPLPKRPGPEAVTPKNGTEEERAEGVSPRQDSGRASQTGQSGE